MIRRYFPVLILLLAVAGCSRPAHVGAGGVRQFSEVVPATSQYLAYLHTIQIDAEESKFAVVHQAGIAACRDAAADLCTVLESQINSGRHASASLKLRAKPAGIQKIISALAKQADIVEQSTSAEDLAAPIADADKKLRMLTDYQSKLEALRGRASTDIDALIKVNHELAEVQSELEALTGKYATLIQRVDTAILVINIRTDENPSFWRPVTRAVSDFGGNLSQGIGSAITGIAFLIPWAIVLGLLICLGRKLWRRRKQSSAKTAPPAA